MTLTDNIERAITTSEGRRVCSCVWTHAGEYNSETGETEVLACWSVYESAEKHGDDARVLVGRRYENDFKTAAAAAAAYLASL